MICTHYAATSILNQRWCNRPLHLQPTFVKFDLQTPGHLQQNLSICYSGYAASSRFIASSSYRQRLSAPAVLAVSRLPLQAILFSGFAIGYCAGDQHLSMLFASVSRQFQQSPQLVAAGVPRSSRLILQVHPICKCLFAWVVWAVSSLPLHPYSISRVAISHLTYNQLGKVLMALVSRHLLQNLSIGNIEYTACSRYS
jgi:hypothetical protein